MSYEKYQQFASESDRVRRDQERQRHPGSSSPTAQEREAIREAEADERAAKIQRQIQADVQREVRARLAQDQELQAEQSEIARMGEQTLREYHLAQIFRTVINGRVAVENQANANIILGWLHEDQGEKLSRDWFIKVLKEQPSLAGELAWQSADAVDPRKQAAAKKQQLEQDRKTFAQAARESELWSDIDANFSLTRSVLGPGFTVYDVRQAVASAKLQLAQATFQEIQQWRNEAAQAHQDYLKNASSEELRAAARAESGQVKKTAAQQQFEFELLRGYERDVIQNGSSPLPRTWNGQMLDASFIKRCDKQTLAVMMRKHGSAQISARLHGIKRVGNYSFEGE